MTDALPSPKVVFVESRGSGSHNRLMLELLVVLVRALTLA